MYKYFKMAGNEISSWESKGFSNEKISSVTKSSHSQPPSLVFDNARAKLIFSGDFLKQDKVTCNHGPIVNIYIVYRLSPVVIITSSVVVYNGPF